MSTTSCRIPIPDFPDPAVDTPLASGGRQAAVFAGGCFWCVEAVFKELVGVESVRSGYAGGTSETANYKAVCSGRTDHAEVIEIIYDPARVSYGQLLKIHFSIAHDPTQLNRQGNDAGRQYRSAIFYANEEQRRIAEAYIRQLNEAGVFSAPIVTTLEPLKQFFVAEDYHQNYAALNPGQPYIQYVSQPKVEKLRTYFRDRLKK
ncbi:MAG TPA: peptide-methionine (S)-S-oxide reductase MsrA [Terriglobia bacterium]|nr:peptide-methionine (S)-S-oxide reductase MsrA [Terriglobia bacterium]